MGGWWERVVVGGGMRGVVRGEVKGVVGMWPEIYEANV